MGKFWAGCALGIGCALAVGALPAAAATSSPGLLQPRDLPAGFTQTGAPSTFTTVFSPVVNPAACSETPTAVDGATGAVNVGFSRPATTSGSPVTMAEYIAVFPDAKTAKAAFTRAKTSHQAAWKCGTVAFYPPGGTNSVGNVKSAPVKFASVGGGTIAETSVSPLGEVPTTNSIIFVSGPYLVTLGAPVGYNAPTLKELQKVAKNAAKRL